MATTIAWMSYWRSTVVSKKKKVKVRVRAIEYIAQLDIAQLGIYSETKLKFEYNSPLHKILVI